MVAIMFVLQISFQIWSIILPRYLMEVGGLDRQHLGKVTGAMGITYDLIRITFVGVFGALSDKFGRKTLLFAGAVVSALSYCYFACTPEMALLLGINLEKHGAEQRLKREVQNEGSEEGGSHGDGRGFEHGTFDSL